MRVTIVIEKDNEQPADFLKKAKEAWDKIRSAGYGHENAECHVKAYGHTLRYDQNSDPTENAIILYENMARPDYAAR